MSVQPLVADFQVIQLIFRCSAVLFSGKSLGVRTDQRREGIEQLHAALATPSAVLQLLGKRKGQPNHCSSADIALYDFNGTLQVEIRPVCLLSVLIHGRKGYNADGQQNPVRRLFNLFNTQTTNSHKAPLTYIKNDRARAPVPERLSHLHAIALRPTRDHVNA